MIVEFNEFKFKTVTNLIDGTFQIQMSHDDISIEYNLIKEKDIKLRDELNQFIDD